MTASKHGTIPEWQPAKASGWFLFPWLRNLKQWTLDNHAILELFR